MLAAFTVSSKYVVNSKVRLLVFICYLIACFFLITCAGLGDRGWITWFSLQQLILIFINIRGIRRSLKDIGVSVKDFKYVVYNWSR
jgi:hypothetical protein